MPFPSSNIDFPLEKAEPAVLHARNQGEALYCQRPAKVLDWRHVYSVAGAAEFD
jgi:hypothetical protein